MVRTEGHNENIGAGLACSVLLHALAVLLAIFGLPQLLSPPPVMDEPMVVEVDTISDHPVPQPRQVEQPQPEEKPEPPKAETPPEPQPKPEPPPPKPEPPKPEPPKPEPPKPAPPPEPEPVPIPQPKPKPEPPKEQPKQPPDALKDIKPPPKKPPPPDDFADMLKSVDKLRQPQKPPPTPATDAPKAASKTVNSPLSDLAAQPSTSEKEFVSAQIWPRWNVDLGAKGADTLQVGVHIAVTADGRVISAELVVDNARYAADSFYRAAADAAKRAVLAASPLKVPPTRPDLFRNNPEMTINFDPRRMVR